LLCLVSNLSGQMTELSVENGHCEGKMYLQDGEIYTDRIVVKFKDLVLDLPRGQRTATKTDLCQKQDNLKNVLDQMDNNYGIKEVIKQIPDIVWGENERPHQRTGRPVKIKNNSQLFTITFKTPVPLQSTIDRLKELDIVEYAHEPITIMYFDEPNDPYFHDESNEVQWYFEAIRAIDAWGITHGSSSVVIGIVDDGFNPDHPDLNAKIISDDGNNGKIHGTQVASVAGGVTHNNTGIASLGWSTKLKLFSIGDSTGFPRSISTIAQQIYVASRYCDLVNMSWGTLKTATIEDCPDGCENCIGMWFSYDYPEVREEIENAVSSGVILTAGAGNQSFYNDGIECNPMKIPFVCYPAAYPGVIAVTGTELYLSSEIFNTDWNYGNFVDVAAPGKNITVPIDNNGNYSYRQGTSFSSPMVCALASLIIALDPYENVENIIKSTADKIDSYPCVDGWNNRLGYGWINAYNALKACFPAKPQDLTLTGSVGSHPTLHWSGNSEADLDGYKIYRKIGTETEYCIVDLAENITSYTDPGIQIGTRFDPLVKYRMSAYDLADNESEKTNYVTTYAGGLNKPRAEQSVVQLPTKFVVNPAHPNPFNSSVVIDYELPKESLVRIKVNDLVGKLIWESKKEILPPGYYHFYWDSRYSPKSLIPSGIYSFVFLINEQSFVKKAVYIK